MALLSFPTVELPPPIGVASLAYTGPSGVLPLPSPLQVRTVGDVQLGVLGKGVGRIAGTVKEKGTPDHAVYRRVRLIRQIDGLQIREAWSDPVTGAYEFPYVDELQLYTVISYDHTGNYNAAVKESIQPELMP